MDLGESTEVWIGTCGLPGARTGCSPTLRPSYCTSDRGECLAQINNLATQALVATDAVQKSIVDSTATDAAVAEVLWE